MKKAIGCVLLTVTLCTVQAGSVFATPITEAEQKKQEAEGNLNNITNNIDNLEQNKNSVSTEINQLDQNLVNLMVDIDLLIEDIATKETQIGQAQQQYDAAKVVEDEQYQAMKKRIKYLYEQGDTVYVEQMLKAESIADFINQAEFAKTLYEYDRNLLTNYQDTKNKVADMKTALVNEADELAVMKKDSEAQKAELQTTIENKRATVADFDNQLASARTQADAYKKTIQAENDRIKAIQAEEERRQEAARQEAARQESARKEQEEKSKSQTASAPKTNTTTKKGSSSANTDKPSTDKPSTNKPSTGNSDKEESPEVGDGSSSNSSMGQKIVNYALQFVGNPYVWGGTSLTNGADCSGFTMSVHKNFGISLPRSSGAQANAGKAVAFENMQPGDVVCYSGHVAIYMGGGKIVHASSASTGIKVSDNVSYRTIVAIRRYY